MYWASVAVEPEAADTRPRFAPILVRGSGPRKGAISIPSSLASRQTIVTTLKQTCSMNRLSRTERAQIIRALVEGNSIRSTSRMTGFAQNTIIKLLRELGSACAEYQSNTLRNLPTTRVECDEIWQFVAAKARNVPEQHKGEFGWGDVWTWVAIDQDSRLIITWLVGTRDDWAARDFISDLGSRLANRVQITTDGYKPYIQAIEAEFGSNVDYARLIKRTARMTPTKSIRPASVDAHERCREIATRSAEAIELSRSRTCSSIQVSSDSSPCLPSGRPASAPGA
jgi:IS1 family transposase/uncharacterized protein YerC